MIKRILFSAILGALSVHAAAQVSSPGQISAPDAVSAIEGAGVSSVNTQATATLGARNTEAARAMPAPTNAERAQDLAPVMEIQYWQAGAGAANGARDAASTQALPRARMNFGTPAA